MSRRAETRSILEIDANDADFRLHALQDHFEKLADKHGGLAAVALQDVAQVIRDQRPKVRRHMHRNDRAATS